MPKLVHRQPSYRRHKTGQAVVTIDGRDYYLGVHGTPESREKYDRLIAEWLSHGRSLRPDTADLSIAEMLLAYLRFAETYYRKHGRPTREVDNIRDSIRPLRELFGLKPAAEFSPLKLKQVRERMVGSGLCRNEVNKRIGRIVRAFGWATEEELIPPSVHHGLRAVRVIAKDRSGVRESEPVKPVADEHVDAIRPHVARQVWTMVELARLTAMRPGEVCLMRTGDIDFIGERWTYRPMRHKNEHHGKERLIHLGPKARALLAPWLRENPEEFLFSPAEAMSERWEAKRAARRTRIQPSQTGSRAKGDRLSRFKTHYTTMSFHHAIGYGIQAANKTRNARGADPVPSWHPNQLRHSAATKIQSRFNPNVARTVLGHASQSTTDIYAEADYTTSAEAMESFG